MKIGNLLIFFHSISFVAVSARDLGILHGKMHVISGRVDAKLHFLVQYRSRFLCFIQDNKLLIYAFIGSVSRDDFDKHRKGELMRFKY